MRPDRSNYEIWFTDWLEGSLNEEQVEELRLFLSKNPDLQEELNGLASISLKPSQTIFNDKEGLVRSHEDITDSQFDHLCIAYLENDLTLLQKTELNEIIDRDEARKMRFELIQKLKLYPPAYTFKQKSILKKLTTGQKIIRLSVIGLSTAAVIALVVSAYLSFTKNINQDLQLISRDLTHDTLYIESRKPFTVKRDAANNEIVTLRPESGQNSSKNKAPIEQIAPTQPFEQAISVSTVEFDRLELLPMLQVSIPENMFTSYMLSAIELIPYYPPYIPPLFDDNRSNVDRFLARIFNEKIMRDTIAGDRPVESFDIAFAGITGLNKLLGWEMALQKNIDENGEIRSYYFSSKLIKINAPVKKTENAL